MYRIILIGNAPIKKDLSEFINNSDFIVRFNLAGNYNKNTGTKVDTLCICGGPSARKFSKYRKLSQLTFIKNLNEIWFTRSFEKKAKQVYFNVGKKRRRNIDYSNLVLDRNKLNGKSITVFGKDIYENSKKLLNITNEKDEPSSGFLALQYILRKYGSIKEVEISLIGFTFQGWKHHLWENEKAYVKSLENENIIQLVE